MGLAITAMGSETHHKPVLYTPPRVFRVIRVDLNLTAFLSPRLTISLCNEIRATKVGE